MKIIELSEFTILLSKLNLLSRFIQISISSPTSNGDFCRLYSLFVVTTTFCNDRSVLVLVRNNLPTNQPQILLDVMQGLSDLRASEYYYLLQLDSRTYYYFTTTS